MSPILLAQTIYLKKALLLHYIYILLAKITVHTLPDTILDSSCTTTLISQPIHRNVITDRTPYTHVTAIRWLHSSHWVATYKPSDGYTPAIRWLQLHTSHQMATATHQPSDGYACTSHQMATATHQPSDGYSYTPATRWLQLHTSHQMATATHQPSDGYSYTPAIGWLYTVYTSHQMATYQPSDGYSYTPAIGWLYGIHKPSDGYVPAIRWLQLHTSHRMAIRYTQAIRWLRTSHRMATH